VHLLNAESVTVTHAGRVLLDAVSLGIDDGDRVGVVGRNGAGKSTLLRVLTRLQEPDDGRVTHARGLRLGMLAQRDLLDPALSVRQAVVGEVPDHMWAADAAVRDVIEGLLGGLDAAGVGGLDATLGRLSGGQLRRVGLARLLAAEHDLVVLDEPTNHLDVDAKTWLLDFMRKYRGALLVISHDLDLLDEAITRVIHLDRPNEDSLGTVYEYKGTYTQYKTARAKDEERLSKVATLQAKEIARLQAVVDRFGAKATKAAMAHSKEKQIARLESQKVEVGPGDRALRVRFPDPPKCGATVITAEHLSKAYGGPPIFEDVSFDLGRGERLLVLGLNGAGKTSLLRILSGETEANLGDFRFGHEVQMGYYAQEHDNLRTDKSLLDNLRSEVPPGLIYTETQLRALLGMMGLSGDKVHQQSGTLSGGEKTKLALAMLMVGRNNLLLLDEPTNNLDPPSRESVASALSDWKGSIIFVSHDTEFVERLSPTKVLLLPDGQVDYFNEDWLELVSLA
jgi:ATPase subunit of ABC transporter with duplicated ATPase domains